MTYWTLWFQERWLMSRSHPNVPQFRLQVTGADGQNLREQWFLRVQAWRTIVRKREHLQMWSFKRVGLLFRWYFTDVLHVWPAQHHLHVEQNQRQPTEWLHTFLQAEPEVHDLSLHFLLNVKILHKSIYQLTLSWVPSHRTFPTLVAHSEGLSWSNWAECLTDRNATNLCRFQVHGSGKFKVKLSRDPSPLSRTFYTPALEVYKRSKNICLPFIFDFCLQSGFTG